MSSSIWRIKIYDMKLYDMSSICSKTASKKCSNKQVRYLYLLICVDVKFRKDARSNFDVNMWSQNYFKCLKTQKGNQQNFKVKSTSMFDLHVDSATKSYWVTTNSKFSIEQVARAENIITQDNRNRSKC